MYLIQRLTGKTGRGWMAAAVLAPLAYLLGGWLVFRHDAESKLGIAISRPEAEAIARGFALEKGVRTDGWKTAAQLAPDNALRFYLSRLLPAEAAQLRNLAPDVVYRFILARPDFKENFEVLMRPSGRVIGYSRFLPRETRSADPGDAKGLELATAALAGYHGREAASRFALAGSKTDKEEGSVLRTYTWRMAAPKHPAITLESKIVLQGASAIAITTTPTISPTWRAQFFQFSPSLRIFRQLLIIPLVLIGIGWAIYRMVIRAREKEIPWKRALIFSALVFIGFLSSALLQEQLWFNAMAGVQHEGHTHPPGGGMGEVVLGVVITGLVFGGLICLAWGALEGDVRESAPEKIRSFDALLGGAVATRTVTAPVVLGFVIGAGGLLLNGIASSGLAVAAGWEELSLTNELFVQSHPLLGLLMSAVSGLPTILMLLVITLSVGRRWFRTRSTLFAFVFVAVWAITVAGAVGNYSPLWFALFGASLLMAWTVVAFVVSDLLTAAVAQMVPSWVTIAMYYLAQPSVSLHKTGVAILLLLLAVLVVSTVCALRGRELSLDSVRPEYVRNIAERIAVQAEIETARKAQAGLFPKNTPAIERGSLAARCLAAHEVNGDYYDFFPLSNGRLAIAAADARVGGLYAALSAAMMKGMIFAYIRRNEKPRQIVQKMRNHLSTIFGETLPLTFLYGVFDPAASSIEFARSGPSPGAFHLKRGGTLQSVETETANGIEEGQTAVESGDSFFLMTDGITDALGADHASPRFDPSGSAEELIERLFKAAERNLKGAEREDDWTAVVISREV